MGLGFYLRAMRRELRGSAGRTLFFVGSLTVGVGAVVGVAVLVSSFEAMIRSQARELLGADLVVSARRPLPLDELDRALVAFDSRAERTEVLRTPTMAGTTAGTGKHRSRLVDVEAVRGDYPLRGRITVLGGKALGDVLERGTVVVGSDLCDLLELAVGDTLSIGGIPFAVSGVIEEATDRLEFTMAFAPRVLLLRDDLERTRLLGFGSRAEHRVLVRLRDDLPVSEVESFAQRLKNELPDASYLRVRVYSESRSSLRGLERVGRFLGLVALLSLLLGGLGVAQVVRTWLESRMKNIAVLRCLGVRPREVLVLYLLQIVLLAVAASLLGAVLGSLTPAVAARLGGEAWRRVQVDLWQPLACARGLGLGVSVALLFSIPPLTALWKVSPALVFRANAAPLRPRRVTTATAAAVLVLGVFLASWSQGGDLRLAAGFSVILVVVSLALWAVARGTMSLLSRLPRRRLGPYLHYGIAALARPGVGTVSSTVAVGLGVLVIVTIYLVEGRLHEELRRELPERAPNAYLWDVQPDQEDGVREILASAEAEAVTSVPVVMARIQSVEGVPVVELLARRDESPGDERRRWPLTREQRLTWMRELPASNTLIAGSLWSDSNAAEVSLERDYARGLGAELGTVITFDLQGVPFEFKVTSLREVEWRSMDVNFFVVVEPGVLDDAPNSRLLGLRLAPENELAMQNELNRRFPNVTVLRVRAIVEKLAEVLGRLALGVKVLGAFTVLVGFVVLAGAVSSTTLRRFRETAVLRTLGVLRRGVALLVFVEYALLGLTAGGVGVFGAYGLAYVFVTQVLELQASLPLTPLPWLLAATSFLVASCAVAASSRALAAEPLATLRSG